MALGSHTRHGSVIKSPLELDNVGHELVVQARACEGRGHVHAVLKDVPEDLGGGGDDAGATSGADSDIESAVGMLDDDGRDGRERPLEGADKVSWRGEVAEYVGNARNRKVVHLIVSYEISLD